MVMIDNGPLAMAERHLCHLPCVEGQIQQPTSV